MLLKEKNVLLVLDQYFYCTNGSLHVFFGGSIFVYAVVGILKNMLWAVDSNNNAAMVILPLLAK